MPDLAAIRARLATCPIPEDAQADWDGSNHYEVQTPSGDEWCWLEAADTLAAANASNTEPGKRLGAVLDYACHYKRDVTALLDALDAAEKMAAEWKQITAVAAILAGETKKDLDAAERQIAALDEKGERNAKERP